MPVGGFSCFPELSHINTHAIRTNQTHWVSKKEKRRRRGHEFEKEHVGWLYHIRDIEEIQSCCVVHKFEGRRK